MLEAGEQITSGRLVRLLAYLIRDRGEGHPERGTRGRKADRAQGLGHRLRKSQAQTSLLSHFNFQNIHFPKVVRATEKF